MYRDPETFRLGYLEAVGRWSALNRPELFLAVNLPEQYELLAGIFERCQPEDEDFGPVEAVLAADQLLGSPA
jgi:spore coat polysaccharide biosynthesis protein SpsF (cytidylyltransferase family)